VRRFRSGFKFALRWLPCVRWYPSDAFGFWGFTAVRSCSLTEPQATRFSTLAAPGGGGGGGGQQHHQQPGGPYQSPVATGCISFQMTDRATSPSAYGCNNGGVHHSNRHSASLLGSGGAAGGIGETALGVGGGCSGRHHGSSSGGRGFRSSIHQQQDRSSLCGPPSNFPQYKYALTATSSIE
jgi:hypothetical protein